MGSQFKFKPDKIKYLSNIDTLDSSHKKKVNAYTEKRNNVPKKEKKLLKLKNDLHKLDSSVIKKNNYIEERTKIIDEINNLTEEIEHIINYDDELEYYEKTHEVLLDYYDIIDGHKPIYSDNINNNSINNINSNQYDFQISDIKIDSETINKVESIDGDNKKTDDWDLDGIEIFKKSSEPSRLDILNQLSKNKRKEKKTTKKRVKNTENYVKDNDIFDYLENNNTNTANKNNNIETTNKKIKYDRASLFEDYKILLDGYTIQKKTNKICLTCGPNVYKELNYSEAIYVCFKCGEVEKYMVENEISNYKDPMIEKPTFPYKRKNHFCEWIIIFFA